jgi:IMP dehydrogenase
MGKHEFFDNLESLGIGVTYADVRLKTGYSQVMPDDVDTSSMFSRNVPLKIPIVSAAMDTVTESAMAIEMARLGGLGIIHKNLSAKEQASEVMRVKYHLQGLIEKPITVKPGDTIEQILNMRDDKRYSFHTFPVVENGKIIGLLTQNDFDFCEDNSLKAEDVMTRDLIIMPRGTGMDEAYNKMRHEKKKVLPLVDPDGKLTGMYLYSDLSRIRSADDNKYNLDKKGRLRVGAAIGVRDDAYERLERLIPASVDVVVLDTAHADSLPVIETAKGIKKRFNIDVVVGNVSEKDSVRRLLDAGVDGIKIGQGPGAICTTRIIAGIGCPQVTAIYYASTEPGSIPICADGGLQYSGDIPIAIGAGADNVMMGSMLAGTLESPGDIVFKDGRQWKNYRGMGSIGAMESRGSRERYNQSKTGKKELIPEGIEGLVPYKGELKDVIFQYVGGLKRGMGYVGAANIQELKAKADFRRITSAGVTESHPHDILITRESPNYQPR